MIKFENGKIFIDHKTVISNKTLFKNMFPFAKFYKGVWYVAATYQNIELVNQCFKTDFKSDFEKKTCDITKYLEKIKYEFRTAPFQHQLEALCHCHGQRNFAYFLEPGLGKTKILIDDAEILFQEEKLDAILVICPKSAIPVWIEEIGKHGKSGHIIVWPEKVSIKDKALNWYIVNHDALVIKEVLLSKAKKLLKKSETVKETDFIYDKIHKLRDYVDGFTYAVKFLLSSIHSMIVIDESTIIAHMDSERTKKCEELKTKTEYRRILTGDPIANTPLDLWSQLNWLDSIYVDNRNYYAFRNHFCIMGGYKNKQVIGYRNKIELQALLHKAGHRVRTDDVFDMPSQNWLIRDVELESKTVKLYNNVVEKNIVPLFEIVSTVSANLVLTKLTKLQQVCGGTLIDDEGKAYIIGNEKVEEMEAFIRDSGVNCFLIWCHFKEEVDMIYRRFKDKYSVAKYDGRISVKERADIIDFFEKKGEIDILILQDDTGHLSLTLNRAHYSLFYSNHQRPIVRNQAERRNWRIGQENPVFYVDFLTRNLVDRWIYNRLKEKRKTNSLITDNVTLNDVMEVCYGKR